MARRKYGDVVTDAHQRFELGRDVQAPSRIVAHIQRTDADRIARNQITPSVPVPQREGEDAVQPPEEIDVVLAIQRVDHLAIRCGLERIAIRDLEPELAMIVDLAVHRERQPAVAGTQRLCTGGDVDDGEALVHQYGAVIDMHATPVGTAMALARALGQRLFTQRLQIDASRDFEDSQDRTHAGYPLS